MSSKYDVIKLKVLLPGNHFYILSRFQLSRMLMFSKVPELAAVKVALDVKRSFVDQERIEVTQAELEEAIVKVMREYGLGEDHARLLPVITAFYTKRVPLVVLVHGSEGSGKTTIAQLLASRLNCNTVVNTEVLLDVVRALPPEDSQTSPSHCNTNGEENEDKITAWRAGSKLVEPAVSAEVTRAVTEGKVLIVEGRHLDMSLYRRYLSTADSSSPLSGVVLGISLSLATSAQRGGTLTWERGGYVTSQAAALPGPVRASCCVPLQRPLERAVPSRLARDVTAGEITVPSTVPGHPPAVQRSFSGRVTSVAEWDVRLADVTVLPVAADVLHAVLVEHILTTLSHRGVACANSA